LPHIFDRFYQADKSRSGGSGTGLGLAIARQIVEAHGGAISAQSVLGIGTRMLVSLPLTGKASAPEPGA
jgi:two-component system sensor histidine kinase ResE